MPSLLCRISGDRKDVPINWVDVFTHLEFIDHPEMTIARSRPLTTDARGIVSLGTGADAMVTQVPEGAMIEEEHAQSIVSVVNDIPLDDLKGHDQTTTLVEWLDISPMMPSISEGVAPTELDRRVEQSLPPMADIFRTPRLNLVLEEEVMPISRAKKIPVRAASHLATHPEFWDRPTLAGPRPRRILAEVPADSFDIFENRVMARLIDRCDTHLNGRIRTLKRVLLLFTDIFDLRDIHEAHWAKQRRTYQLLEAFFKEERSKDEAERTMEALRRLKYKILGFKDSELYRSIPGRSPVPPTLPSTNILTNDGRYRRSGALWRDLARNVTKQTTEEKAQVKRSHFNAFCRYGFMLVLQALHESGCEPLDDIVVRYDTPIEFMDPCGNPVTARIVRDGMTIEIDCDGRRLLFLPVLASLSMLSAPLREEIMTHLSELADRDRGALVVMFPDALEAVVSDDPAISDLEKLAHDLNEDSRRNFSTLPISPWRAASLDLVTRAVNWHVLSETYRAMPPTIELPRNLNGLDEILKSANIGGTPKPGGSNPITASPDLAISRLEAEIARMQNALAGSNATSQKAKRRSKSKRATRSQDSPELLRARDLLKELEKARTAWKWAMECPICQTRTTTKSTRQHGFWLACKECKAEWGTQECEKCRTLRPINKPHSDSWVTKIQSGRNPARIAGSDLLSFPILDEQERIKFRCPECGCD